MKKFSLILCSVAMLCLINVTNIRADGTVNQTNSTYTPTVPVEQPEEEESTGRVLTTTLFEGFDQKANQLFNLLSAIMGDTQSMVYFTTRTIL